MSTDLSSIPAGYHSVTPLLTIKGAAEALDFYKKAFGAEELFRLPGPDGKVMHAEIKIGNSILMLSDEFPEWGAVSPTTLGGCHTGLLIYVTNADAAYDLAIAEGAASMMPVSDQFWGDRMGTVIDPYGFKWSVAHRVEEVSPEEIQKRLANMKPGDCGSPE